MERQLSIAQGKHTITITLSLAKFIKILDKQGTIVGRTTSEKITAPQVFYLSAGDYTVVSDGNIDDIKVEKADVEKIAALPQRALLSLRSDARAFHAVDGIGEIPADGKSFVTITILKLDASGRPLERKEDNDDIYLRTNYGAIKDAGGEKEIRSLKLKKGQSAFRLYSEERKRVATVEALTASPSVDRASIRIEFC